jgi:hypothetical protein
MRRPYDCAAVGSCRVTALRCGSDCPQAATSLRQLELEVRVVRDELDRLQQTSHLTQERDASTIDALRVRPL